MKSIKALGVAALTVVALAAFSGSAMAAPIGFTVSDKGEGPEFRAQSYPAVVSGAQSIKLKLITDAGTVSCATANFSLPSWAPNGKIIGDTSELLLQPTQKQCSLSGLGVTVKPTSNCMYTVAVTGSAPFIGTLYVCETEFDVDGSNCAVTLKPQTRPGMEYVNVGSGSSATVEAIVDLANVTYSVTGAEQCPFPVSNTTYSNGKYRGTISLSAKS